MCWSSLNWSWRCSWRFFHLSIGFFPAFSTPQFCQECYEIFSQQSWFEDTNQMEKSKVFSTPSALHFKIHFQFHICNLVMRAEKIVQRFTLGRKLVVSSGIEITCFQKKKNLLPYLFRFTSLASTKNSAQSFRAISKFSRKVFSSRFSIAFISHPWRRLVVVKSDEKMFISKCLRRWKENFKHTLNI